MSYYSAPGRGDYYTGRGDLGGFLKRAAKGAIGFFTGGVPGLIAGVASGGTRPAASTATQISIQPPQIGGAKLGPSFQFERYQGARGSVDFPASDGACPRGFHLAKDGSGRCVRNRHMNVGNSRALMRAIRRQEGFVSLAKRMGLRAPPGRKVLRPKGRKR